jgi:glycosyltransferase involved in cell wall biosynthesis
MEALRVLHLSTTDRQGGAARAAHKLHTELVRQRIDSRMFVLRKTGLDEQVSQLRPEMDIVSRVRRRRRLRLIERQFNPYWSTWDPKYEIFNTDMSPFRGELVRQLPDCNLINLHWVAELIDYRAFFDHVITVRKPVVWRLADMNPLTGGCHYDWDCGKFVAGCGNCPQLGSARTLDLAARTWLRKQCIFSRVETKQLHFVALCEWMAKKVRASALFGRFDVTVIPNGVDLKTFCPKDKAQCKLVLGIDPKKTVLLLVADTVMSHRKGGALAAQSIQSLARFENFTLLTVGKLQHEIKTPCEHIALGTLDCNRLLSLAYNAADLFIAPSLQENLPNTVLESIACGTPVAGFSVGGIPEIVKNGETGVLSQRMTADGLSQAIADVLSLNQQALRKRCVDLAVSRYDLQTQARKYIELYARILDRNGVV